MFLNTLFSQKGCIFHISENGEFVKGKFGEKMDSYKSELTKICHLKKRSLNAALLFL